MLSKGLSLRSKYPPLKARHDSAGSTGASSNIRKQTFEKSEQGGSSLCNFRYGAAAMQGFRPHMQDDFCCAPTTEVKGEPLGFFAVFDGHGHHGDVVSQYCSDNFLNSLLSRKALRNARKPTNDLLKSALRKTFMKFDKQLGEAALSHRQSSPEQSKLSFGFSGTTATAALVFKDSILVANVGDSRTLLCRSGGLHFFTTDHNPGIKTEDDRILAAGGKVHTTPSKHKVILDPEAYTNLAVSRALGDFGFKRAPKLPADEQVVIPVPDVTVLEREHRTDEFLLLASDGIFKSLSNDEVVKFVRRQLTVTDDLTRICHNLIEMAYYSPGISPDDTTVVLVVFPAAPTPIPKAIREEASIEAECTEAIENEIQKIVANAEGEWVLENDYNIIQQLVKTLPMRYCIQLRTKFISKTLCEAKEDRFGVKDFEELKEHETEGSKDDNQDDRDVFTPGNINTTSASADEDNHREPEVTECVADCTNKTTTDVSLEETARSDCRKGNEAKTSTDLANSKSSDDCSGLNADVDSILLGSDCNITENNSIFDNNVVIM